MKTLASLTRRMKDLNREIPAQVNDIAKKVSTAVLQELVASTPVDTSKAVSNWNVNNGSANFSTGAPHVPGAGGSTRGASSAITLATGTIFIRSKKAGVPLHVSNGLPYIVKIDGSSSSPGFKNKGIDAGEKVLQNAKLKL